MNYQFSLAKFCSKSFKIVFDTDSWVIYTVPSKGKCKMPPNVPVILCPSPHSAPHKPHHLSFQLRISSSWKFFPLLPHKEQVLAARFALDDTTPRPKLTAGDGHGSKWGQWIGWSVTKKSSFPDGSKIHERWVSVLWGHPNLRPCKDIDKQRNTVQKEKRRET